ncbi:MAG TPA: hypothetical protein VH370_22300 [Humisphaera sp.]|nr:hypothetical protein [Humisphaera sp.]
MTLTIEIPADAEARLKERAQAAGQEVSQYVGQLITKELAAPLTIAQAAKGLARAVDATGVSDDEFASTLMEARDAARRDRRKGA